MKNPKLSNRYAKALFDFAGERNQIEEVFGDLQLFANTLKENRELQMLLRNPVGFDRSSQGSRQEVHPRDHGPGDLRSA